MIDRFIGKDDTMKKITLSGGFLVFLGAAFWSLNGQSSFRGMDGRWFMSFPTQAFA